MMPRSALLFVIVFTAALYWYLGAPEVVRLEEERQAELEAAKPEIHRLEEELKANPKDAAAWAALGQKYMEIARYTASSEAYRRAVLLSGGHPALILQYNKALIFAANGEVSDKANEGMAMVLKLDPGNPEARYFMALHKFQQGEIPAAMAEIKALYKELPADSPLKAVIDRQIGRK